jgi:hypothetical protein
MVVVNSADAFYVDRLSPGGALNSPSRFVLQNTGDIVIAGSNAQKPTGTTWANPSDIRLKKNIAQYTRGLNDILKLEPISYTLKSNGVDTCGFDAEKVREVFPECVSTVRMKLDPADDEEADVLTFDMHSILVALVNAVKELSTRVTQPSDSRIKLDVQEDCPGLSEVLALRPVTFLFDQTKRPIGYPEGRCYGLIAQEAQPYVPSVVVDDGAGEGYLAINYGELVAVLIRGIKELEARVRALEPP